MLREVSYNEVLKDDSALFEHPEKSQLSPDSPLKDKTLILASVNKAVEDNIRNAVSKSPKHVDFRLLDFQPSRSIAQIATSGDGVFVKRASVENSAYP